MPLTFPSGSVQVFTLTASNNTVNPFAVTIAGAAYGNDTTDVVIAPDGLSVAVTINSGNDNLVLTVISPNATDGALLTLPSATPPPPTGTIFKFFLTQHFDGCSLPINGTP